MVSLTCREVSWSSIYGDFDSNKCTWPELAIAAYDNRELVVMVPKGTEEEEEDGSRGGGEDDDVDDGEIGTKRLISVQ
ncbi:Hypothetical predicted protein [Olea europaea subsp. europaea]|uniref:Uncharacterized protein n=1 Tax=Olea europaea subsp. europaea TaxID=158383 RepID=A0A8S0UII7_OLEEU|nr:Hypothetical predicted protein [Olea europaea subsp. europaea]